MQPAEIEIWLFKRVPTLGLFYFKLPISLALQKSISSAEKHLKKHFPDFRKANPSLTAKILTFPAKLLSNEAWWLSPCKHVHARTICLPGFLLWFLFWPICETIFHSKDHFLYRRASRASFRCSKCLCLLKGMTRIFVHQQRMVLWWQSQLLEYDLKCLK